MSTTDTRATSTLGGLVRYFLYLGALGFGGPAALVGFMHRDLVEGRRWISEDEYRLGIALSQIMPGPLAAQLAIALGYFQHGVVGATLVGLAFVTPSFFMVLAISMLYVAFGGLWWMQALFYGIGAAVIAIIGIAAYKLARSTNQRDPMMWTIFVSLLALTVWARAELAEFFVVAGLITLFARTRPTRREAVLAGLGGLVALAIILVAERWLASIGVGNQHPLLQILTFFTKAGAFVFGSGLAIVPFLHQGVVQQFGWLNEQQFVDAVAVAMITPGPVVITVVFIGYLVAGFAGAVMSAIGIFLPVYLFTIVPAPWFSRNRANPQLKAFVHGATAAATGAIAGAVVLIAMKAIYDVPTALIAVTTFAVLWRYKVPEPIVVLAAGLVGLVAWPLLRS
ncbi:MAG: chromate efflux transporter [Candidatus Rokubacteria bacterium]|nr:chromate efflux transporter [Candidatus Rokubacteria bacterium]